MTAHQDICPQTGKRMFGSRRSAMRANLSNHKRLYAYLCRDCWRWHVSVTKRHKF